MWDDTAIPKPSLVVLSSPVSLEQLHISSEEHVDGRAIGISIMMLSGKYWLPCAN